MVSGARSRKKSHGDSRMPDLSARSAISLPFHSASVR
jgi:hypothetical protein